MKDSSERRSIGRVAIPAGIIGVGSVTVPVAVYAGVDLIRLLLG